MTRLVAVGLFLLASGAAFGNDHWTTCEEAYRYCGGHPYWHECSSYVRYHRPLTVTQTYWKWTDNGVFCQENPWHMSCTRKQELIQGQTVECPIPEDEK
jgi:hypothetical protein